MLAASLATGLVPHRALATPGDRVQKRTRIPWTLILAVLLPAASSLGQTPPGDSYLCYKAALAPGQATFTPVQKGLQDQFGMLVVDVKRVLAVCNPAQTAVHQVGYKIARAKTPPQPVFVKTDHTAIDQFGAHALTLLQPVELRAPSAQVLGAGGTGLVDTTGVDHFECYKAVPARNAPTFVAPPPVAITDEFGTVTLTLNKITKLCTPVNTNGEDVTASQHVGHLVCYQAKLPQGTRFAPQTVSVNNTNFGPAVLVAKAVAELCVPAFKDAIPTTTTSTTTTTLDCFTDTGDGTIHDTCTGLQWEKKDGSDGTPNAGDLHDVDNRYSWAGCARMAAIPSASRMPQRRPRAQRCRTAGRGAAARARAGRAHGALWRLRLLPGPDHGVGLDQPGERGELRRAQRLAAALGRGL